MFNKAFSIRATGVLFLALILCREIPAQSLSAATYSLDVPVDPASLAMGESFTAQRASLGGLEYNPATVADISSPVVSYGFRNMDIAPQSQHQFASWKGAVPLSFGTIFFMYNRHDYPDFAYQLYTASVYPDNIGTVSSTDCMYGVGYARSFGHTLDAGIALKCFDISKTFSGALNPSYYCTEPSTLLDAGILYHSGASQTNGSVFSGQFVFGAALQNFGSDFRITSTDIGQSGVRTSIYQPLPRYFRAGISYSMIQHSPTIGGACPFIVTATGEYRNVLNQPESSKNEKYFWGFGVEATLHELVSLRGGGVLPFASGGYSHTPSLRYGIGLRLPLRRIGISSPLAFQFDYASTPLGSRLAAVAVGSDDFRPTMRAYSLTLKYEGDLFAASTGE